MSIAGTASASSKRSRRSWMIGAVVFTVLILAMALDTKVVAIGGAEDVRQQVFDPDRFGQAEFPRIRDLVLDRAPDAATLVAELEADKTAAVTTYGVMAGAFPVLTVEVSGTVEAMSSGIATLAVEGLPEGTVVRVQTGPAINGTELRDIPGDIAFGDFTNQIEYQDAGSGINRAMAAEALADLDREALTGKSVTVTGAFKLINPKNWLITPVALEVAG